MNQDNLVSLADRTEEDKKRIASMGGKARATNIQRRKTLKEELLLLLEDKDNQKNMTIALLMKALDGDIKAFEVVRDTIGEKPTDKIEADVNNDVTINITLEDESDESS